MSDETFSENIVVPLTPPRRAALAEFLSRPGRPESAMTIGEVQGFFFSVAASPDLVQPAEWYAIVFGGELPTFEDREQAEGIMGALLSLFNVIVDDVREGGGRLPDEVKVRDDVLKNMDHDSPLSEWSRGFIEGHLWLQKTWQPFEGSLADEFMDVLWTLGFFATGPIAEAMIEEVGDPEKPLEVIVKETCDEFARAASVYAMIGVHLNSLRRERKRSRPAGRDFLRPGRNDPCSCGSLKKYKKCCGRIAQA